MMQLIVMHACVRPVENVARSVLTITCDVVLPLADWSAGISAGRRCALSACLTLWEASLPLLAS